PVAQAPTPPPERRADGETRPKFFVTSLAKLEVRRSIVERRASSFESLVTKTERRVSRSQRQTRAGEPPLYCCGQAVAQAPLGLPSPRQLRNAVAAATSNASLRVMPAAASWPASASWTQETRFSHIVVTLPLVPKHVSSAVQHIVSRQTSHVALLVIGATPQPVAPSSSPVSGAAVPVSTAASPASSGKRAPPSPLLTVVVDVQPVVAIAETPTRPSPTVAHKPMNFICVTRSSPRGSVGVPISEKTTAPPSPDGADSQQYPKNKAPAHSCLAPSDEADSPIVHDSGVGARANLPAVWRRRRNAA